MAAPKAFKWPVPAAEKGSGKEVPSEVKKKRGRPRRDVGEAAKPADAASFFMPASARQKLQKREIVAVDAEAEEAKVVLDPDFVRTTKRKGKGRRQETAVDKGGELDGADGSLPKRAQGASLFVPASAKQKLEKKEVLAVAVEAEEEKVVSDPDFVPTTKRKGKRTRQETAVAKGGKIGGVDGGLLKRAEVAKVEKVIADDDGKEGPRHLPKCLRTESRLAAEENARLSAGKKLHPFFQRQNPVSGKLGKLESDPCGGSQTLDIGVLMPCPPLHVTQSEHAEAVQLDWGEVSFVETCCGNFESSDPCEMPAGFVLCRIEKSALPAMDQVLGEFSNSIFVPDEKIEYGDCQGCAPEHLEDQLLKYMQSTDNGLWLREDGSGSSFSRESLRTRASLVKACRVPWDSLENGDRIDVGNSGTNPLWTDIYQPKCPEDVCGNSEEVRFLDTWLETWQKKILSGKRSSGKGKVGLHEDGDDDDDDKGWFQDDSDSDADSALVEDDGLENTLLLTGPVGSGKTAAVYACAVKQGFSVIEVNTADLRNGSLIKQKFGEALESHGIKKWPGLQSAAGAHQEGTGVCEAPEPQFRAPSALDNSSICPADGAARVGGSSRKLTVILFEDVDVVFEQDRGFFGALVKLVTRTKRPIILTSNKRCPSVPPELRKLSREFKQPCTQTLVVHACMAADAEGVACSPQLMECIIKACQHDMRQVLMLLQFWNQGRNSRCGLSCGSGICAGEKDVPAGHRKGNCAYLPEGSQCSQNLRTPEQARNWPLKTRALGWDLQQQLRPILLPLSFPCSLTQHVAGKVSEAARQLHLCATFAGILSSTQVQEVTSFQDKEESVDEQADAPAPRVAVCVSPAKSMRLLRAVARSGRGSQRVSNISEPAEMAHCLNKQETGCVAEESCERKLMPLQIEQSGKTVCWCKAPAQTLGMGHVCLDDMGRSMKPAHVSSMACEDDDFQPTPPAPRRRLILRLKIPPEVKNSDIVNGAPPARRKRRLCKKSEKEENGCQQVVLPAPTVVADPETCIVSGEQVLDVVNHVDTNRANSGNNCLGLGINGEPVETLTGGMEMQNLVLLPAPTVVADPETCTVSGEQVSDVVNRVDTDRANSGDNCLGLCINGEPVERLTGGMEMQNLSQVSGDDFIVGDAVTDLTSLDCQEASRDQSQATGLHPQPVILSVHSVLGEQVSDVVHRVDTDRANSRDNCLGLGINGEPVEIMTGGMEMQNLFQVSGNNFIVGDAVTDLTSLDCDEASRDQSQPTGLHPQPVILSVQSASTNTRNGNADEPCSEYLLSKSTQDCSDGAANLTANDGLDVPDVEANKILMESPVIVTQMAAVDKDFDSAAFPPCEDLDPHTPTALSYKQKEFDEAVLNILRESWATPGEVMAENLVKSGKPVDAVSQSALSLTKTTARLTDIIATFDIISNYSAWEGAEKLWGFHLNSLEDKGAYLADLAVQMCLRHCSDMLQSASISMPTDDASDTLQKLHPGPQVGPGPFDWLRTDANPCDADHNLSKKARWGMLKSIVLNLVPTRIQAAVTGSNLHDYSMALAHISKLEYRRQKSALTETGGGSRRSGRGFLHHLTNSIPEDSIPGLLSHSMFERGISIPP